MAAMTGLKRPGGEQFNIEGRLFADAKMKMIIDGYTGTYELNIYTHVSLAAACIKL
jgi:hypothetical protein